MPDMSSYVAAGAASDAQADSGQQWRATRRHLNGHRRELAAAAAALYPDLLKVCGAPLLARPEWLPSEPVPLEAVDLHWQPDARPPELTGREPESSLARPLRQDGQRYPSYVEALIRLDRPRLLEDRRCYRLLEVGWSADGRGRMTFGRGTYFDIINTCEAVAHEYTARRRLAQGRLGKRLPFRALIGDPTDPRRRPLLPAISTLTLRRDPANPAQATFVVHWRDPRKVASGGGLYQVAPVGVFQPSHDAAHNETNDLDLWRSMVREYSEEFLGTAEDYGSHTAAIDYDRWPLYRQLTAARRARHLHVSCLGLGVDALTLVTDLLVVAVFDADIFDDVFDGIVSSNDEGASTMGVPFDEAAVERFADTESMQPAGAALLRRAWQHRERLLFHTPTARTP
jgi:hypothetical protein